MLFRKIFLLLLVSNICLGAQDTLSLQKPVQILKKAPVVLNNDTLFYFKNGTETYPVEVRANEASLRLKRLTAAYNPLLDSLWLRQNNELVEIMFNNDLALVTTLQDAVSDKTTTLLLAKARLELINKGLKGTEDLTTKEWAIRIGYFVLLLVVLILYIKLINWVFRKINLRLSKIEQKFLRKKTNILKYFIPKDTANIFVFISNILRIAVIAITLIIYAPFMFSFFPWAENVVNLFYGYIAKPVKYVFFGFVEFIPSLFFILIIAFFARYFVRIISEIANDVEIERFKIKNFHKDWAKPTGKILAILIYALALILIFPYLPGSGSAAFQGISIFIGALISFGSTSAIANIIAGIVITYMRPFQIGDRIKVDQIVGDVIEKTILVTRIRTTKKEEVTIPNAKILSGTIVNYSNEDDKAIILYTSVTLGYDVPWETAEELLLEAALNTQFIIKEPKPFVLQTSLDDYYVSYELNAYTSEPKKMPFIYSEMHKNILNAFNQAGVEILSPSYVSARDGSLTTVAGKLTAEDKSPLNKIVDHLTGQNQNITITKEGNDKKG
ncbi:mechanosensitive ion channel family protein [uncultured Eudoraea sp.]|jgi:small-conductance mechanosensitive channel|uniref:mechanosensitive ion channel family protein n=1 Tax=uncultured Eudoraea sp. TaxID=1035614 RepID=UPI002609C6C5|nr:mechanosensitive ion channel family protein [uncultured Eudoraea sp.]